METLVKKKTAMKIHPEFPIQTRESKFFYNYCHELSLLSEASAVQLLFAKQASF